MPRAAGTPRRPQFPNPPVGDPITIVDLALELSVPIQTLDYLAERGYLTLLSRGDSHWTTMLAMPDAADLQWLRGMLALIPRRPMLPIEVCALGLGVSADDARSLIIESGVPFYVDPVFGEVVSLQAYQRMGRKLFCRLYPLGFDRLDMLRVLTPLLPERKSFVRDTRRVENEIGRIAKMEEPDRTLHAMALWESWNDAEGFLNCIQRYEAVIRSESALAGLRRRIDIMDECLREGRPWKITTHRQMHWYSRKTRASRQANRQKMLVLAAARKTKRRAASLAAAPSEPSHSPVSESTAADDAPSGPTSPAPSMQRGYLAVSQCQE